MKYEFTDREAELLSDGVLRLIQDASDALKMLHGSKGTMKALREYLRELQHLNTKICKEESK